MNATGRALTFEEVWIPPSAFRDEPTPSFKLCLVLAGAAELSYRVGDRARRSHLAPGSFTPVSPPSVEVPLGISSAQRHLLIELDEAVLRRTAAAVGLPADHLGALHERPFRSPFLSQVCARVLREQKAGDALGSAFVESIQELFVLSLLRLAHGAGRPGPRAAAPLLPATVARVRSHCLERIGERIAVAEMADVAGVGAHDFSRSFKRATGLSPQQFLIGLRVARAADLLAGTALPLPEIALQCGFFDQAHLAGTFSRHRGMPPSRYRRAARG